MKIGLLTTSFPRSADDTAGAFVLGFARALVGRGHSVEVLAPEPRDAQMPPSWPGIELRWVPYLRPRSLERTFYGAGVPDNLLRDPLAWLGLAPFALAQRRAARARVDDWDALVSHWALPCALNAASARGARPHLAVVHSADLFAVERAPFGRSLARRIGRGASDMLFVSPAHRDRFLALLPPVERVEVAGRCHVSPMGIEESTRLGASRRALRAELGLRGPVVLSLSRLVRIKGLDDAVRAIAALAGTQLVIAGEGPERARLERLASRLGASVRFVGHVSGERKRKLLAVADVFVAPSRKMRSGRTEGVPTAIIEAMAAGLAVVTTKEGGMPSVVEDGRSGVLVAADDPRALRAALFELLADAAMRRKLGRAAASRAKRYTWGELAPHIESLLLPR